MKNIRFLFLMLVCVATAFMSMPAMAQDVDIPGTGLTLSSVSTYTYTGGSNVLTAPTVNVTTSGGDTTKLKLYPGNQNNMLHFWFAFTKNSGATDSMTVTVYGIVKSTTAGTSNTIYKSLYSAQTANSSGEQLFEYLSTGNNYTDYMVVWRKIGVAAGSGNIKKLCLVR